MFVSKVGVCGAEASCWESVVAVQFRAFEEGGKYPEGAFCRLSGMVGGAWVRSEPVVVRGEGRVVRTWERNGYHDSDFYATLWLDSLGEPREVEYATTRFPSDGNDACVDASDEVMGKYRDWLDRQEREAREACEKADRVRFDRMMLDMRVTRSQFDRLRDVLGEGSEEFAACVLLLSTRKFRSEFRSSLADQVRVWVEGGSKWRRPLSSNQFSFVMGRGEVGRVRDKYALPSGEGGVYLNLVGRHAPFLRGSEWEREMGL